MRADTEALTNPIVYDLGDHVPCRCDYEATHPALSIARLPPVRSPHPISRGQSRTEQVPILTPCLPASGSATACVPHDGPNREVSINTLVRNSGSGALDSVSGSRLAAAVRRIDRDELGHWGRSASSGAPGHCCFTIPVVRSADHRQRMSTTEATPTGTDGRARRGAAQGWPRQTLLTVLAGPVT